MENVTISRNTNLEVPHGASDLVRVRELEALGLARRVEVDADAGEEGGEERLVAFVHAGLGGQEHVLADGLRWKNTNLGRKYNYC